MKSPELSRQEIQQLRNDGHDKAANEIERLREEIHGLRVERAQRLADAVRVIEWIRDSDKPAVLAFTESAERQIAYAVENDRLKNRE